MSSDGNHNTAQAGRKETPAFLKALGRRALPTSISVGDRTFELETVFKNDFFAVTSMYASGEDRVLLKVGRQASLFGLPLRWVGRWLTGREVSALSRLEGVAGIPRLVGRWEDTGFIREFVDGSPMKKGVPVPDDFHDRLRALIDVIHDKGMAYVDLEKCENVLVGADGRPYLFDFQICWQLPRRRGGELPPARMLRRWFQNGDRYHLLKLKRRTRPDLMTDDERDASYRRPWYVRVHRVLTRPFTAVRRALLNRIDPRTRRGERGRVSET